MSQVLEIFPYRRQGNIYFGLYIQNHGLQWPVDARGQRISKFVIYLVFQQYPDLSTRALSQYKDSISRYGDSNYKIKMVVRPSYLYLLIHFLNLSILKNKSKIGIVFSSCKA